MVSDIRQQFIKDLTNFTDKMLSEKLSGDPLQKRIQYTFTAMANSIREFALKNSKQLGDIRKFKEECFQTMLNISSKYNLNLKVIMFDAAGYGYPGYVAMAFPEGNWYNYSGFNSKYENDSDIQFTKYIKNDSISSIFVSKGYKVTVFKDDFGSKNITIKSPGSYNLSWHKFNDGISSWTISNENHFTESEYRPIKVMSDSYKRRNEQIKGQTNLYMNRFNTLRQNEKGIINHRNKLDSQLKNERNTLSSEESENRTLSEKNSILKQQNASASLKAQVGAFQSTIQSQEGFESLNQSFEHNSTATTAILSGLVILLSVAIIRIAQT